MAHGRYRRAAAAVNIVQRVLPHYRVPFFRRLAERLGRDGVALQVIYGQESRGTVPRSVRVEEPWARRIRNTYLGPGSRAPVWQPCLARLVGSDLLVVEQANRLLLNYPLIAGRGILPYKLAYWGHGRNMQAADRLRGSLKRRLVGAVDWWFAYTRISAEAVAGAGFPAERITEVHTTVDTDEIETAARAVRPEELAALRGSLGIRSDHVALYCGGMYPDKKLDFLLAACAEIRRRVPDFHVVFIGDGPLQETVAEAARRNPWIHYVGPRFGPERVPYFLISRVMLMPGLVGLAIIDSFATGTPMFTTDVPIHSPEIAYLENGVNGVMTPFRVADYAGAVAAALASPAGLDAMRRACRESARRYDLAHMVESFARGVQLCLESPGR